MDKIDTQGMSGPANSGGTDNIYPHDENGEPILPRAVITPHRLHTHQMVKELKIIIYHLWGSGAFTVSFCLLLAAI